MERGSSLSAHQRAEPRARNLVGRGGRRSLEIKLKADGKARPFSTSGGQAESNSSCFAGRAKNDLKKARLDPKETSRPRLLLNLIVRNLTRCLRRQLRREYGAIELRKYRADLNYFARVFRNPDCLLVCFIIRRSYFQLIRVKGAGRDRHTLNAYNL